ncbi:hypothetical protein CPB84DRAFT_1696767 [Gymnopilus junonius]|uniref:Uncharacterized protein n=1 Tax=Gymnopilus junonius TaxID=109634 RepID=A0A9P5TFL2_GYMJU|nr:hypothetical protein CPB84DRAFT_1696767 [Gymnopilus junonius]
MELELQYPLLTKDDCQVSTAVSAPNSSRQSSDQLSWLWSNTCLSPNTADMTSILQILHLNWLHARAQKNRWAEELELTKHEMEWTVRFYMYMATTWQSRRDSATQLSSGHCAYAEKQIICGMSLGMSQKQCSNI